MLAKGIVTLAKAVDIFHNCNVFVQKGSDIFQYRYVFLQKRVDIFHNRYVFVQKGSDIFAYYNVFDKNCLTNA